MSKKQANDTIKKSLAIIALILNLGIPGLGSVIGGRTNDGIKQLLLTGSASLFAYLDWFALLVGVTAVSAWIWALITSAELLQEAFSKSK
jgi:TM2 domain-containing membrane protein YozV